MEGGKKRMKHPLITSLVAGLWIVCVVSASAYLTTLIASRCERPSPAQTLIDHPAKPYIDQLMEMYERGYEDGRNDAVTLLCPTCQALTNKERSQNNDKNEKP
jgi:hypothetical protein